MVIKRFLHVPMRYPHFVQLDITNLCNLSCDMCPVHHVNVPRKHIDFEVFKKIIDRLKGVREISLVGLGEPLSHPRIFDAVRYCKSKGMVVKITSNGLLLDRDRMIRGLVESGLDTISISLESISRKTEDNVAHRNGRVVGYIDRLLRYRASVNSTTPKVALQAVLFKDREDDIADIVKWAADRDIHRVNVLRMHIYFKTNLERPGPAGEKDFFNRLEALRKKYKVRVDCLQDRFGVGIVGLLYKYLKYFLRLDSCCTRLLDYPMISQNGDVIPCCVLPKQVFGNVLQEDLREIWLGSRFTNFRKTHNRNPLCAKCDTWRLRQVQEIFKKG